VRVQVQAGLALALALEGHLGRRHPHQRNAPLVEAQGSRGLPVLAQ
jgi:hypothetical protein